MKHFLTFGLALSTLALPALSQGTVWTVNTLGTADFTDIPTAVAAASDGDTVLVEQGGYFIASAIDIDAKSLALIGGEDVSVTVFTFGGGNPPAIHVRNLAADQSVTVRGFVLGGFYDDPDNLLFIEDNLGPVHIEDVTSGAMGAGITLVDNASVTVANSVLLGSGGGVHSFVAGAIVTNTNAFFYDTEIHGADGPLEECSIPFVQCIDAGWGGVGVRASGASEILLSNCLVQGGDAGCAPAVGAAVGLDVAASSIVRDRGSVILGGAGGPAGCTTPGMSAGPSSGAGTITALVGEARTFGLTPPVLPGGSTMEFTYTGTAGDFAFLLYRIGEPANAALWFDPLFALHLDLANLGILPRGVLPASGVLVDSIPVPGLIASLSIQTQALISTKAGHWVTSGSSIGLFYVP